MNKKPVSTSLPKKIVIAIATCTLLLTTTVILKKDLAKPIKVEAAEQPIVEDVVSNLNLPVPFAWLPDNSLLIGEKGGRLLHFQNGQLKTITTLSVNTLSERGLLGIAVDPLYNSNHTIYLFYTTAEAHNRLSKFTFTNQTLTNETILLDNIYSSSQGNHNGGDLHFDSNRNLYVSTGDGGGGSSCNGCSQKLDSPNGKILKINPDTGEGVASNPFNANTNQTAKKVWAYGLRNPYRFALNSTNEQIYIADVGENRFEELDRGIAGANYGWPQVEGPDPANQPGVTYPIFYYARSGNADSSFNGCSSITGGAFAKGNNFPSQYAGNYFFGDYVCKKIWNVNPNDPTNPSLFLENAGAPVNIAFGPDGALYFSDILSGKIKRVTYNVTPNATPTTTPTPTPTQTTAATPRNTPTPTETPNTPPTLTITRPVTNSKALPGETITLEASATDAQDSNIPISWNVVRHHGTSHTHPWAQATGTIVNIIMPEPEDLETAGTSYLEAIATATDTKGAKTEKRVTIYFDTVQIAFQTQPAGLKLKLNNIEYTAPVTMAAVKGQKFTVAAANQTVNNIQYVFGSWSDNLQATHTFTTPQINTTLRATFNALPQPTSTVSPMPSASPTIRPTATPTPRATATPTPTSAPTNTPISSPSSTPSPTPVATEPQSPTATPTSTPTPTATPLPTATPTLVPTNPTAQPTSTPTLQGRLILCSYQDLNANGIYNWGDSPRNSSFTVYYNGQSRSIESQWWHLWTQGCAKAWVPTNTQITITENRNSNWISTAVFADGAKIDGNSYTYLSDADEVKIVWFLNSKIENPQPSSTPTPQSTSTPTTQPTSTPINTQAPSSTPLPTPTPTSQNNTNIFDVTELQITKPFEITERQLSQPIRTVDDPQSGGKATLMFIADTPGTYRIRILAIAPDNKSNSIFYNIDKEPGILDIWDFKPNNYLQEAVSSMRTNNLRYSEQIVPKTFQLTEGTHELVIRGREPNFKIQKVSIEKIN